MSNKKKSKISTYLAANLLALRLVFLGIELLQNKLVKKQSTETLTVTASDIKENKAHEADFNFETVEEVSAEDVIRAQFSNQELLVIGSIAVPEVTLHLPILNELANENLLAG